MLVEHLGALEKRLLDMFKAESSAPCDLLLREYFEPLFGADLMVGAGRVVDSRSEADAPQVGADILLCRRHGPRLQLDGLSDCFLAESVVAAISVTPYLDGAQMARAVSAARSIKQLRRSSLRATGGAAQAESAELPDTELSDATLAIPCFVLAFDGPQQMDAVHVALKHAYREHGIEEADLPDTGAERLQFASPAVDGVFVLGRGFLNFDNTAFGFFDDAARHDSFGACWSIASAEQGSLVSLFMQISLAADALAGTRLDPRPYLGGFSASRLRVGN